MAEVRTGKLIEYQCGSEEAHLVEVLVPEFLSDLLRVHNSLKSIPAAAHVLQKNDLSGKALACLAWKPEEICWAALLFCYVLTGPSSHQSDIEHAIKSTR